MSIFDTRPATAAWKGALGFGLASLLVFVTVAYGERWMFVSLGAAGAYLTWTILFIVLGGLSLRPVAGWTRAPRFLGVFAAAFLAYAAGWIGSYTLLHGATGEWVGAVVGPLLMAMVLCAAQRAWPLFAKLALTLLVAHVVGYFGGAALTGSIGGSTGMLLWGVPYGLGMGAGLGIALAALDRRGR